MIYAAILAAIVVASFIAYEVLSKRTPSGWTADTDGNSYGTTVDASGSFDFPLSPNGVHYVTKACGPIDPKSTITLSYRVDADPGVSFCPSSDPKSLSIGPTLYFQREGDDWSGQGRSETYRWWATFASPMPIVPGNHVVSAPLAGRWTAVETSNSIGNSQAFLDALAHAARIGFTFGGGTGYGHGVFATGKARFTLLSLEIAAIQN